MLKWFADRLAQTGKEVRKDERGFTLIELLVVVIIIGLLAAIAIPTFLSQRDNAREAALESDLRNAGSAATSCAGDNDGSYADCNYDALVNDYDFNPTDAIEWSDDRISTGTDTWSVSDLTHEDLDGVTGSFDIDDGQVNITGTDD